MRAPEQLWRCDPSPRPDLAPLTRRIRVLLAQRPTPLERALGDPMAKPQSRPSATPTLPTADYLAAHAEYASRGEPEDYDAPLTDEEKVLVASQDALYERQKPKVRARRPQGLKGLL